MYVLQEKVQRTYNWVMSQDSKAASPVPMMSERRHSQGRDNLNLEKTTSSLDIRPPSIGVNCNFSNPVVSKPFTLPNSAISSVLDNVWSDKGVLSRLVPAKCQFYQYAGTESPDSWPEKLSESGLGLGELACRLNKATTDLDMSAWESHGPSQPFC